MEVDGEQVIEFDKDKYQEAVSVPETARFIGQCACFNGLLSSLNLENSNVAVIEEFAFSHCYYLGEVKFPSCLQEIGNRSFLRCHRLNKIAFGTESKLIKIGDEAFWGCRRLETFDFPPLLESIGTLAFCNTAIYQFNLRATNARDIGSQIFGKGSFVSLPATVTSKSIFNCCSCELTIDERHPLVKRDECGCLIMNRTIIQAKKKVRRFLIRRGVERIGKSCFKQANLISLTIPSSVKEISDEAFLKCEKLKFLNFAKNSNLSIIGKEAFHSCYSLKKIKFPKSLKIIKSSAFHYCSCLKNISFPVDSQLERIEGAFQLTKIKHLSIPQTVREIDNVLKEMDSLESIYINNDLFKSNEEGNAILSSDGSELICVVNKLKAFRVPEGVRVIKEEALRAINHVFVPSSVEVIEKAAFTFCIEIKFESGSKLRSLDFMAFHIKPERLIINNENFITMDNGVVVSLNTGCIVLAPLGWDELYYININNTMLPKSKNKFLEDGKHITRLYDTKENLKLFLSNLEKDGVQINGKTYGYSSETLELPPNLSKGNFPFFFFFKSLNIRKIICPRSSLLGIIYIDLPADIRIKII